MPQDERSDPAPRRSRTLSRRGLMIGAGTASGASLAGCTRREDEEPRDWDGVGDVGPDAGDEISTGPVLGLTAIEERLPWFDSRKNYRGLSDDTDIDQADAIQENTVEAVTSTGRPPMDHPISCRLSRQRYPAEDRHFDVVLRFDVPLDEEPSGRLEIEVTDDDDTVVSEGSIGPIPGSQCFFSYGFPDSLVGESGTFVVRWVRDGGSTVEDEADFWIQEPTDVDRSGQVEITVPNDTGATVSAAPMSVGVPFPQGALDDTDDLRLVDDAGDEIPMQAEETATWSRFGSIRWIRLRFSVDLHGDPRTLQLEYGPDVSRDERSTIAVDGTDGEGLPTIDAGRLQVDEDGIAFDLPNGDTRRVIDDGALTGAYVEDTVGMSYTSYDPWLQYTGRRFTMTDESDFVVDEVGSEAVVLRSEGWYEHEPTGEQFCKYVNRYVVYRDSPVVRLFHTWVFTGDGNADADSIRDMGWSFSMADDLEPLGFLSSFDDDRSWLDGFYLRQNDSNEFTHFAYDEPNRRRRVPDDAVPDVPVNEIGSGDRAAGAMAAAGDGVHAYMGVKDFWQNFPGALSFEDDTLSFQQWPRYGTKRTHANTWNDPNDGLEHWRLWFAHEGENLSFELPETYLENPIYLEAGGVEPHYTYGREDSVNAQGTAKTAEMWLYLTDDETPQAEAERVLEGLNEETLRAVVDPEWLMGSGALGEGHHRDGENYPQLEAQYDRVARSLQQQWDRIDLYGKWLYGDFYTRMNLDAPRVTSAYRGLKKAHHGAPYRRFPYLRSGDSDLLKVSQAATRMMTDVAFVEYVDDEVRQQFESLPKRAQYTTLVNEPYREKGWHNRNMIPWAGYWGPTTRMYVDEVDYLWNAYHATGYDRARDVALQWAEATKEERPYDWGCGPITTAWNRSRWRPNLQRQYLLTYQETFDPWFLAASQAIADMNIYEIQSGHSVTGGQTWNTGPLDYQRYTGSEEHLEEFYEPLAEETLHWRNIWGWIGRPTNMHDAAFAYEETGDRYYLRRAAGFLDLLRWYFYGDDEPSHFTGFSMGYPRFPERGSTNSINTEMVSFYLKYFHGVLDVVDDAGGMPDDFIPLVYDIGLDEGSTIAIEKTDDEPIQIYSGDAGTVVGPDGELELDEHEDDGYVLPASAPQGTYRVETEGGTIPLTEPDTPEVVEPVDDTAYVPGCFAQFYVEVPEDTDAFTIQFDVWLPRHPGQLIIYDPDGEEVWAWREHYRDLDADRGDRITVEAEVSVPAEHEGELWRVASPTPRSGVQLGPELPGRISHSSTKWFDPDE